MGKRFRYEKYVVCVLVNLYELLFVKVKVRRISLFLGLMMWIFEVLKRWKEKLLEWVLKVDLREWVILDERMVLVNGLDEIKVKVMV